MMRKLAVTICAAVALALPTAPAGASEPAPPAGVQQCPTGDVGIIVWAIDPKTGTRTELVRACVLITP